MEKETRVFERRELGVIRGKIFSAINPVSVQIYVSGDWTSGVNEIKSLEYTCVVEEESDLMKPHSAVTDISSLSVVKHDKMESVHVVDEMKVCIKSVILKR